MVLLVLEQLADQSLLAFALAGQNGLDSLVVLEAGVDGLLDNALALLVLSPGGLALQLLLHHQLHGPYQVEIHEFKTVLALKVNVLDRFISWI